MEENNNQHQQAQQPAQPQRPAAAPQQQLRPCPKDCRKCSMAQQMCCSAMLSFQMYDVMNSVIQRIDLQSQRIADLETRLQSIQSTEAELSAPELFKE
jgi:hypothetical protein